MAEETPICDFGWKAPPFTLPATDGKTYSLEALRGKNGTLVMFICNHCPYVKAVIDRIVRDCEELRGLGIGAVAISSNDVVHYPEDSFANMTGSSPGCSTTLSPCRSSSGRARPPPGPAPSSY